MKLSGWRLVVASSLILAALANAETRPQYGGTLHVALQIAPVSLDPADPSFPDSISRRNLTWLVFDTMVSMDPAGRIRPALAATWQSEPGYQRWQFTLRHDVKFHDGSQVAGEVVAASLRFANPGWTVSANGASVTIECKSPAPNLLSELALPRNAIAKRASGSTPSGTGPFHVSDWQPGKKLTLAAQEDYWGGRVFLDSVVVELGKSSRDQFTGLELGKADIIEIAPEQARRATMENERLVSSAPVELMALVFAQNRQSVEDGRLREALSLSIDRTSIRNVLLQGQGELAGGVLPVWLGGYEFVFSSEYNLARAQQLRGEVQHAPVWTLGYDPNDQLARLVAERVALNARDSGLRVQSTGSGSTDVRVARILLSSADAWRALSDFAVLTGLPQPKPAGSTAEDLYQAENAVLQTQRIIPLLHFPASYAISPSVKSFQLDRNGRWQLPDVWLGAARP
jgi:peptide/nickel transport system substrate-binding protein